MKKWVLIVFSIVFVIFLVLGGVYSWITFTNKSGGFAAVKYYPESHYYIFNFIVDGDLITKPIDIKDVKGNTIAISKITAKAQYTNVYGFKDSMLIPLVIQKQNGDIILFSDTKYTSWQDSMIPELAKDLENSAKWNSGSRRYAVFALDLNAAIGADNNDMKYFQYLISNEVTKYQEGRLQTLQNFIKNGDSKIGLIIPIYVDRSSN